MRHGPGPKLNGDLLAAVCLIVGIGLPVGVITGFERIAPEYHHLGGHPLQVIAAQVGGALTLFGLLLRSVPGPGRRGPDEPAPLREQRRPRGWHAAALVARQPGRPVFAIPERCSNCAATEVLWEVPVAIHERGRLLAGVVGLGMPPILGDLFGRMLVDTDAFSVKVCQPCLRVRAARERSLVHLRAAAVSLSTVALASSLAGHGWPLLETLTCCAALGVVAAGLHQARFRGLLARPGSLVTGPAVHARLVAPGAADTGAWTLRVRACDPTWLRALIEANARTYREGHNEAELAMHEAELRAAGLR